MKELDRSGELLALCYREQWPKASQLLSDEHLTSSTVASALHQAVVDSREEVLLFLLTTAPPELFKLNTSVQKDGKTLLHLALESNNLRFIHALLTAGADIALVDKKGVRPMDLMTWTAIAHPTVMVPLQDNILHLQQRNELQRQRTQALNDTSTALELDEQTLAGRVHEIQHDVAAVRAFRTEVDAQIRRAQDTEREIAVCIDAEDTKLQLIRGEVARLHTQNGTADLEVARINAKTQQLNSVNSALRVKHGCQQSGRDNVAGKRAVKCEMIGMLRQFPDNGALQTRALRALLVMCKKPTVRRQLLMNGLQDALIDVLQKRPRHASVHLGVCQLVMLLSSLEHASEEVRPWHTSELVEALLEACISVKPNSSTILDELYRCTSDVCRCLKQVPKLNNIGGKELHKLLDDALQRLESRSKANLNKFCPAE